MRLISTKQFVFLVIAAAVIATAAVARVDLGLDAESMRAAAYFALIGVLAQVLAYQTPRGISGNISFIPFLSAVVVAPALPVVISVACAVMFAEALQKRNLLKAAFNISQYTLAIALAVIVFHATGGRPIGQTGTYSILPFVVAFAIFLIANTVCVSGVIAISSNQKFAQVWWQTTHGAILYDIFAIPVVYGFGYAYASGGVLLLFALVLPLFGLRQLYKTNWQLETFNEELLQLMVAAIEARDPYTSGHSQRVATYTRIVCEAAGLGSRVTDRVYKVALLHDVGKIHEEFAPILRKPGRLTEAEFTIMKTHSERGAALVGKVTQFRDLLPAIRSHHEAWDGHGYPDGLVGASIPHWARIVAIADTIDAMTTDRPYRVALDEATVHEEVRRESAKQFDPQICERLLRPESWERMAREIMRHTPRAAVTQHSEVGPSGRPSVPQRLAVST